MSYHLKVLLLAALLPLPALAEQAAAAEKAVEDPAKAAAEFTCPAVPDAVVTLDHGSRYVGKDKSHSNFDAESNAEVNAQLKPIDAFIGDLSAMTNLALQSPEAQTKIAGCALSSLAVWAKADALSDLQSLNAQLSSPPRVAGFAFAYDQMAQMLPRTADNEAIEAWLTKRATQTMTFFDVDAPANASRNNLRAWAALAVARIGLTLHKPEMIDWADASVRLVACQAAEDGSLPLEMERGDLALHYQLHAVTPLVVTAALLQPSGHDLFNACDKALHRSVDFVVKAFEKPALVKAIAGDKQSYFNGGERLQGFEVAWSGAYLSLFPDSSVKDFVAPFGPLANSKIGGLQSLLWPHAGL